jgi:hypothetical protein
MSSQRHLIHTTHDNVAIFVDQGKKVQSPYDFIVRYQEPGKRIRTPKHIHLIVDLYLKRAGDDKLTSQLTEHIIDEVILKMQPAISYPPALQVFSQQHQQRFNRLDLYGEYSVEFLLVITELIMIQEKTNYPTGTINLELFRKFHNRADIFSVISAATFR